MIVYDSGRWKRALGLIVGILFGIALGLVAFGVPL